jgi:hypothetical protein
MISQVALASLIDVKRVLRIPADSVDEERDAQLRVALAAVESLAESWSWKQLTAEGPQAIAYWDIREDATIHLPANDVVVTKVRVFEYPSSFGIPLSPIELGLGVGYDLTDDGKLIMRPSLQVSPFEGATASRVVRAYSRVEVHYIGTGVIPAAVTEGIAFLAAGFWSDGPRALRGLTSERIGDYSYTMGDTADEAGMPSFIARAMWLLKPFLKRSRVQVV